MKIRSITLKEYGPIRDFSLTPANFELIFGFNESGKTAIVEALINILFKKTSRVIRYGKPQDIRIEIEHAGQVLNPADKKTAGVLPMGEIGNLHYVQASETELYQKDGANFWEGVKLTLSQAGAGTTYAKIIKKIYEKVGLQAKEKDWAVAKKPVVQGVLDRKVKLETYFAKMDEIEGNKKRARTLAEECAVLEKESRTTREMKQYLAYENLRDQHARYRANKNALADHQRYEDRYLEEWRQLDADKKSRGNLETNLQKTRDELNRLEKDFAGLKRQDDFIRQAGFEAQLAAPKTARPEPNLFYPALIALAGVAVLILAFRFHFTMFIPTAIFAAAAAAFLIVQYRRAGIKKDLYENELTLEKARLMFPELKSFEDLRKKIEAVRIAGAGAEAAIREKRGILQQLSGAQPLDRIDQAINELRNKTGLAEFTDLQKKIAEKNRLRAENDGLRAKIGSIIEEPEETRWPDLIAKRKVEKPETPIPSGDQDREDEIRRKLDEKNRELDDLRHRIGVFESAKREIYAVTDYREALIEYNDLTGRSAVFELEKRAALKAEEILNTLSEELDDFIRDIARGTGSLSEYFQAATGHYPEVAIRDRDFIAVDRSGREFPAGLLSSGTRDQLLLCFRMAALEKFYPDGSFLILDDAFIFSDWPRRQKMVELLKRFADKGGQVIYLTSDDHTREIFAAAGAHVTTIK